MKPLRRKYTYLEAAVTWKEGGHEWVWLTEIRSFQASDEGDRMASINKGLRFSSVASAPDLTTTQKTTGGMATREATERVAGTASGTFE